MHNSRVLYVPNQRLVVIDLHLGYATLPYMATHKPMLQVTGSTKSFDTVDWALIWAYSWKKKLSARSTSTKFRAKAQV